MMRGSPVQVALAKVREAEVERQFVLAVEAIGGRADKVVFLGRRGCVDRLVALPGRLLLVELKRPRGGRISRQQAQLHADYRRLGIEVAVVSRLEDIPRLLAAQRDSG
jgi:hypothetical protein